MLLFKRILNSKKAVETPADKRMAKRYAVGQNFPFKAVVTLMAHDEEGNALDDRNRTQAWGGRLIDLSEFGANIHLNTAAVARREEPCTLKLSVDDYILEFPCTIAHFRVHPQYASCGVSFNFPHEDLRRAYQQVLEPVAIGSTLTAIEASKVTQDTAGLVKEQYLGIGGAMLTVWKRPASPAIYSFDFRMNAFGVRWSEGMTEVEPYGLSKLNLAGKKTDSPFIHLTTHELDDVRWLFCLAVPNVAKSVPPDIRKFLTTLVA